MKFLVVLLALFAVTYAGCPRYSVKTFTKAAGGRGGLAGIVRRFGKDLGDPDNESNPGPLRRGRRSINWDADIVPFKMPGNFFDVRVPRGAVFKTRHGQFRVSNPPRGRYSVRDDRFDSIISPAVAAMFKRFSPPRLFSPLIENKFDMTYKIPGRNERAVTSGYGVVFVDVDKARKTKIDFFDPKGCRIGTVYAPPRNRGLSFAGLIVFDRSRRLFPIIAKAVVTTGTISLKDFASRYRGTYISDLVVMDDFIYGEPQSWPRGY